MASDHTDTKKPRAALPDPRSAMFRKRQEERDHQDAVYDAAREPYLAKAKGVSNDELQQVPGFHGGKNRNLAAIDAAETEAWNKRAWADRTVNPAFLQNSPSYAQTNHASAEEEGVGLGEIEVIEGETMPNPTQGTPFGLEPYDAA